MYKITRVLIPLSAGLLAIIFSLSLLTAMTASAHSMPTAPPIIASESPPAAPLKAAGGADNFGYTYQDETEAFGPTYVFTDISSSGTNLGLDDEGKAVVTTTDLSGFNFDFYGVGLTSLTVSNNGVVLLNSTATKISFSNPCPLSSAYPDHQYLVTPWWDDWGNQGDVYWEIQGTAPNRQLIIQWNDMVHALDGSSNGVTFQSVFFETSNIILFQYQDTTSGLTGVTDGNNGTVGILADDVNLLQYETCNSGDPLTTNRAIRFSRNSITVVKDTLPASDPQSFDFTTTSISTTANFTLTDNLNETFYFVPGIYTVAETLPTDWDLTNLNCTGGANISTSGVTTTVTLGASEEVVCTYENTKRGSITVVKDATPDSTQPFTFTGDLTTSFILDDDGTSNNPYSNTITFPSLQPGIFDITEASVPSWNLANINCVGGDFTEPGGNTARVALDPGEDIICTFDNTQLGTLIVQKVTVPSGLPTSFAYTASVGLSPTNFNLAHGNSRSFSNISPGTYAITETVPTGWTMASSCDDGSLVSNISIAAGETVTCVFTNTANPGSITVEKYTVPAASPEVFTFTTDITTPNFTLSHGGNKIFNNVIIGTYNISETIPAGWTLSSSCSDGSPINAVDVGPGENITCVFTNTANFGSVTIEKVTDPFTSTELFTFTSNLTTSNFTLSNGGSQAFNNVTSGSGYTVTESTLAGWDVVSTCSDGSLIGNIDVSAGENITCIFTNTQRGNIIIDKITLPASNTTDFDFSLTGGPDAINQTFALSDTTTPYDSGSIKPGSYSLTETPITGWTTVASCDNGDDPTATNVTLDAGETVTCTYTNTKLSTLIVTKVTDPSPDPTSTSFSFTAGGGLSPSSFSLTNGISRTFPNLISGTYTLSETVPSGWSLVTSCDNGDPINNIAIGLDETVTCVFTNTAAPGSVTVQKVTEPTGSPEVFTFTTNLTTSNFTLSDGNSQAINSVTASSGYTVAETTPAGWDVVSTCSDGSLIGNIDVSAGENITCIFTNTQRGNIIIDKVTFPASNTTDFDFSLTGGPDAINQTFALSNTTTPYDSGSIKPGSYALAETPITGWSTMASCDNGDDPTNITLDAGETISCTFTNTKLSTLVVTKVTDPSPDPTSTSFSFTAGGGLSPSSFSLANGDIQTFTNVVSGTYTFSETIPSGWSLTSSCDNGDPINNIAIGLDETVTCVFTNTAAPGSVMVQKVTDPFTSTEVFTFTTNLTTSNFTLSNGGNQLFSNVTPGNGYTVAENTPTDWGVVSTCSDGSPISNIDVSPGENITCIFTNTQFIPSYIYLPAIFKNYEPPQCTDIDLQVTSLSIAGEVVTVVVENTGACPTDSGFWVDLYADPQTQPSSLVGVTSDRRWNSSSVNATHGMGWEVPILNAGSSITLTSDGSVGPNPTDRTWPPASGATIYAYADSFDSDDPDNTTFVEIPETNENNNQSTSTVTITGLSQNAATISTQSIRPDLD